MNKRFLSFSVLLVWTVFTFADVIAVSQITPENVGKFGGSMYEYLPPQKKLSPVPKGFKPFYLSHYGRHGSRYLLDAPQYERPYTILKDAYDKGVLTDFGKTVLDRVELMMKDADGRLGDLTTKGMEQHKGITHRMMDNYPVLFGKHGYVVAKSTTSHRVLVSMLSGLSEIYRLRPDLKVSYDASEHDVVYLNREDGAVSSYKNNREKSAAVSKFNAEHTHPDRLMSVLFTDTAFIRHYEMRTSSRSTTTRIMDASSTLYTGLYDLAANMQSHDLGFNLDDVFTAQEWYDSFAQNNVYWYSVSGYSPLTGEMVPYGRCALLRNFIELADAAVAGGDVTVNLRYGHDTTLFPFLCLMDINDCNWSVGDLERLADRWVDYDIVHMASNIQWVFFRNKDGKILVKFLLNEEEATIPIDCYTDPKGNSYKYYYEWDAVRKYYQDKLDYFDNFKANAK